MFFANCSSLVLRDLVGDRFSVSKDRLLRRSAKAFRFGERAGSLSGCKPESSKMDLKPEQNFVSRSCREKPLVTECAGFGIRQVARNLVHPFFCRVSSDAGKDDSFVSSWIANKT